MQFKFNKIQRMIKVMIVVDLFSGAGGLTEGFYREGYKIIAHVEKDKWACETLKTRICYHYLKEKKDLRLYNEYLRISDDYKKTDMAREIIFKKYPELQNKLKKEVINKAFGNPEFEDGVTSIDDIIKLIEDSMEYNDVKEVDIIIGGPPCQAYSIIGRSRMKEKVLSDKRNYLFQYYKDIVSHFKPKLFVFENVPGILTAKKGLIFEQIQKEFKEIGYNLLSGVKSDPKENILDSKDFGVYESRKRMILIGYSSELNIHYPDFSKYVKRFKEDINANNAISDLPPLQPGEGKDLGLVLYPEQQALVLSKYQKLMRKHSAGVLNHCARSIQDRDRNIYRKAILKSQEGKQLYYWELDGSEKTHKNQESFLDRFKVHGSNEIPHTIVAHISKDGHYNIHPDIEQCRSLTVREAARIQSFPDNYKFEGPRTAQYTQVGNAVPPLMAEVIARTVKNEILSKLKVESV